MQILKLSNIWKEERPAEHKDYDGQELGSLPLYQYTAIGPGQFRLLYLQPGTGKEQIQFELKTADLQDSSEYEAVSYAWEEIVPSCNILSKSKDSRLPVTKNGIDALWHFRLPDKTRVLWMDVVCINQDDAALDERAEQVVVMHQIFSGAQQTLAWAGNAARFDKEVFNFLAKFRTVVQNEILHQVENSTLSQNNPHIRAVIDGADDWVAWIFLYFQAMGVYDDDITLKDIWYPLPHLGVDEARSLAQNLGFSTGVALHKLCHRQYFHRYWVMQELVLSKRSILYVGRHEMPWDSFVCLVWLISRLSRTVPGLHQAASSLAQIEMARASRELTREGMAQYSVLATTLIASGLKATRAVDRVYAMLSLGTVQSRAHIRVSYKQHPVETYFQVGRGMMNGTTEEKAGNIAMVLVYQKLTSKHTSKHEGGILPSWVPDFEAYGAADWHVMGIRGKFHAGGAVEHFHYACFDPSDNRVLGLRGKLTGSIDSFADLDPEPLHEFDIELFEYQNENGFQLGYAIPSTLDFFRIVSPDPPKSSHRNEEVKDLMLSKQRHLLSRATRRLKIMKEFAGETTDDDTFWRAVQADFVPRVMTRAPKEKPFPGVNMKFLDATPSLAEPSNWTATHPVLQSMSRSDLEYAHSFLGDTEPWREAKFGRTAKGHLAWMPAKAELTDSICLFGGASTFHVIRPDPDSSGRWKIIGPAYVQGLMDGEAAPNQYSEDDFLWIS